MKLIVRDDKIAGNKIHNSFLVKNFDICSERPNPISIESRFQIQTEMEQDSKSRFEFSI